MDDCKKCKLLRQIIDGQNTLLACYRLGTHRGVDGALNKIESAKRKLAKLEGGGINEKSNGRLYEKRKI